MSSCALVMSTSLPMARLERRLDYRRVAWVELAAQASFFAVALPLALMGHGELWKVLVEKEKLLEAWAMGRPVLANARVSGVVVDHVRGPKVRIFKMRRRKHYQKHGGHRQNYTEIQIGEISA